jgi:hypothetical protein
MSDITVINDSEQSSLVTNGLAKNGELYLKAAGSTDAGAIVVYDSGSWRTFANEASAGFANTYSVDFDGTNDYIQLPNGVLSTLQGTAWSISAWYNLDVVGNYQELFTAGTDLQVFFRPRNGGGAVGLELYVNGASYLFENSPYSSIQTWINAVISVDTNGTSVMYINGSSSATAAGVTQPTTVSNPVISCFNGASYFLEGKVDEFALFNTALSASDATAIYNSGTPADLTSYSPVGWWRMGDDDSGTGTTITDQGSGGNDGTLTNGPTFSTTVPS